MTTRRFDEGDTICPLSALHFDSKDEFMHFLNMAETRALMPGPHAHCSNVLPVEAASPPFYIYSVFVGLGRFLLFQRLAKGKAANAAVVVHPEAGANDMFYELVATSRSRNGIAKGKLIFVNFGLQFDRDLHADLARQDLEQPAKKLKGDLDAVFENLVRKRKDLETTVISVEDDGSVPLPALKVPKPNPDGGKPPSSGKSLGQNEEEAAKKGGGSREGEKGGGGN